MDIELSDEQRLTGETVRQFAEDRVRPRAREIDRSDEFPWDLYSELGQLGVLGMTLPAEYGGSGADNVSLVIALEELARVSGAIANIVLLAKLQSDFVYRFGDAEQRRRYAPAIASGSRICLIAATEPEAGSDVAGIRTHARRGEGGWLLKGRKAWITAGAVGDVAVVLARTDSGDSRHSEDRHRGISAFIVEKSPDGDPARGFVVEHKDEMMGMRGLATAGIAFQGTCVPHSNLLGREGEGFRYAMQSFDTGRIVIAALALGLAVCAHEESVRYARSRQAFGRPIGDLQAVQLMIADMSVAVEAARHLVHHAAFLKDRGRPFGREAACAKLFASDAAVRCATDAVQVHGGYGYSKESTVERVYRDAKLTQIYEGTNQIQRVIIARHDLREPATGSLSCASDG